MRIIFLYEPDLVFNSALDYLVQKWMKGLSESQVSIKVISDSSTIERISSIGGKIEWAASIQKWTWTNVTRVLRAALPFRPQLIHAVLGRKIHWQSPWPFLTILSNLQFPLVLTLGDGVTLPDHHPLMQHRLPPQPEMAASLEIHEPREAVTFVPGPLSSHADVNATFAEVLKLSLMNPEHPILLGFDWSEMPVEQRLSWRERWLQLSSASQIRFLGSLGVEETLFRAARSSIVRNDLLKMDCWLRALLQPSMNHSTDLAINTLLRSYHRKGIL